MTKEEYIQIARSLEGISVENRKPIIGDKDGKCIIVETLLLRDALDILKFYVDKENK